MSIKRDGHIHTPFCPHGSSDSFHSYIERAVSEGLHSITFTEHAPLPGNFEDPVPGRDSAMSQELLDRYFYTIEDLKKEYKKDITILAGLEIDFIEGFERETKKLLDETGPRLDDSILSVHFLRTDTTYTCLDYSLDSFASLIEKTGSAEKTAQLYYHTLLLSIRSDLGDFKPRRLGHITLIKKFQQRFPEMEIQKHIGPLLEAVHEEEMTLDYNGAGTAKPMCREPYPDNSIAWEAKKRGIPLIYGSDAHQAKDMMQGLEEMISF
ncbi:histidinol-phosphatase HisJ [Salibacterium aidingense]|uniref:histidinol-phosphatase HisJ n=1 Tax=Salibacterium aidingense TaxID=384933 RepID=UPI0003F8EA84|nr:histidinol-phosphatase HisJ [Salibacterium aidingense]